MHEKKGKEKKKEHRTGSIMYSKQICQVVPARQQIPVQLQVSCGI